MNELNLRRIISMAIIALFTTVVLYFLVMFFTTLNVKTTYIGSVYVGDLDLSKSSDVEYVTNEINTWVSNNSTYRVTYQNDVYEVSTTPYSSDKSGITTSTEGYFTIDLKETISDIKYGEVNGLNVSITNANKDRLLSDIMTNFGLDSTITSADLSTTDVNSMINSLIEDMSLMLTYSVYQFDSVISDEGYTVLSSEVSNYTISDLTLDTSEFTDLTNITIPGLGNNKSGSSFSLNDYLTANNITLSSDAGNALASVIVGSTYLTNIKLIDYTYTNTIEFDTDGVYIPNMLLTTLNDLELANVNYYDINISISVTSTSITAVVNMPEYLNEYSVDNDYTTLLWEYVTDETLTEASADYCNPEGEYPTYCYIDGTDGYSITVYNTYDVYKYDEELEAFVFDYEVKFTILTIYIESTHGSVNLIAEAAE